MRDVASALGRNNSRTGEEDQDEDEDEDEEQDEDEDEEQDEDYVAVPRLPPGDVQPRYRLSHLRPNDGLRYNPSTPFSAGEDGDPANVLHWPNEPEPPRTMSLESFVGTNIEELYPGGIDSIPDEQDSNPVEDSEVVRVPACGRSVNNNAEYRQCSSQLAVDPSLIPRVDAVRDHPTLHWDYDSAYVRCERIPVGTNITMSMKCDGSLALLDKPSLFVEHPYFGTVEAQHVPNVLFARFGAHGRVYICFPGLMKRAGLNPFPDDLRDKLYDHIYDALCDDDHESPAHPSKNDGRSARLGRLHTKSFVLLADMIEHVVSDLLSDLAADKDLRGTFFVLEIRGARKEFHFRKHEEESDEEESDEEELATLDRMFEDITKESIEEDAWVIDKALELRLPGHRLQPAAGTHADLLSMICPTLSRNHIADALESPYYQAHTTAQVYAFEGFSLDARNLYPFLARGITRISAFSTCGKLSHSASRVVGTDFESMKPVDLLAQPKLQAGIERMRRALKCIQLERDGVEDPLEGALRIKMTVTLPSALQHMSGVDQYALAPLVYKIAHQTFYNFLFLRLTGLAMIFENLLTQDDATRRQLGSMALGVVACYMQERLFQRETTDSGTDGPKYHVLRMCGRKRLGPNGLIDIGREHGVYFSGDIFSDANGSMLLPKATCKGLDFDLFAGQYGLPDAARFGAVFNTRSHARQSAIDCANRSHNRTARKAPELMDQLQQVRILHVPFRLPERWDQLQTELDASIDAGTATLPEPALWKTRPKTREDTETRCSQICVGFVRNVIENIPNGTSNQYTVMSQAEKNEINSDELMRSTNLEPILSSVRVRVVPQQYHDKMFERIFPPYPEPRKGRGIQHYNSWSSLDLYRKTIGAQPNQNFVRLIRDSLRAFWDDLVWVPAACSDRIWDTRDVHSERDTHYFGDDISANAPLIAVRDEEYLRTIRVAATSGRPQTVKVVLPKGKGSKRAADEMDASGQASRKKARNNRVI